MEELKAIRVFLAVVDQLSFAGAARSLAMTPASVTRIVAQLEADLGHQLLLRTTRKVSLTSTGAMVAARYKPIVDDFDRATEDIAHASRPDRGRLRINAPLSMGVRLLPSVMTGFRTAYPRIDVDLRLTDTLIDIIGSGCDLAIRVSSPPTDRSTIWRKLCEVPRDAVASPGFLASTGTPKTPDDLERQHCLSYSATDTPEMWEFSQGAVRRSFRAGRSLISNNGDFLCEVACAGAGICVLPDFITQGAIDRGDLVRVLPDWTLPSLWLTLYYPPYERLPPLVATFTDYFEAYLRDLDGLIFA